MTSAPPDGHPTTARRHLVRSLVVLLCCSALGSARADAQTVTRVHELGPDEGVFAYSRISPSGRYLAYSAERREGRQVLRTVKIIDLKTRELLFSEPGIDAYWSPDERRIIYLSYRDPRSPEVAVLTLATRAVTRGVAPVDLGDYFSWADAGGRDLILTIQGNYYQLQGDRALLPAQRVTTCPGIGMGERPLISKDGRRITTFVRGRVVVRGLDNCQDVLDTQIAGGKADFSWDGRYIALHAPKPDASGYEIQIVDVQRRTVRRLEALSGSSVFPSWTSDGRLSFRYDADDYHGFVIVSGALDAPERPLASATRVTSEPSWNDLFPQAPTPAGAAMVLVWSTWSAHSEDALKELQRFSGDVAARAGAPIAVRSTLDISSKSEDAGRMRSQWQIRVPEIERSSTPVFARRTATQMPMYLLFEDGRLVGDRLGAQTAAELAAWWSARAPVKN
jgi:hypothetical protein